MKNEEKERVQFGSNESVFLWSREQKQQGNLDSEDNMNLKRKSRSALTIPELIGHTYEFDTSIRMKN